MPVERVRLGKQTVTDHQIVGGEVRREEIELDVSEQPAGGFRSENIGKSDNAV